MKQFEKQRKEQGGFHLENPQTVSCHERQDLQGEKRKGNRRFYLSPLTFSPSSASFFTSPFS
jgi:hypothetical protein